MAEFLTALEKEELTDQAKLAKCEVWLLENPHHKMAEVVKISRNHLDKITSQEKTITSQEKTITSQEKTITSQEKTITSQEKTITSRSLASVKMKFPVLIDTTISLPYLPDNHRPAKIHSIEVSKVIPAIADPLMQGKFWDTAFTEDGGHIDHENSAQHLVVSLLKSVLKAMHLNELVGVSENRTLAGVECDVLLVYKSNRLPFAVIEVKKPGNSRKGVDIVFQGTPEKSKVTKKGETIKTGGNRVAGEVFAEMVAIQMFGYSTVTGMISTGNQWRIVGLLDDKSDQSPGADMIEACVSDKFREFLSLHQTNDGKMASSSPTPAVSPEQGQVILKGSKAEEARCRIWAGEIVPSHKGLEIPQLHAKVRESGKDIVTQLVFFIAKTCSYLFDFLKRNEDPHGSIIIWPKMPCRILQNRQNRKKNNKSNKHDVFAFGSVTLNKLVLEKFNPKVKNIYVIRHLGMGEYGNVCLGTSKEGTNCCAIKFYHDKCNREQFATEECENWECVYKNDFPFPKPFVLRVAGGHCLVMPYLHPIQKTERLKLLNNGVIETMLKSFANSGFLHCDIKWRHFCRWKNDRQEKRVFLIDLGAGSLEKYHDGAAVEIWIKESIHILRQKAGEKSRTEEMLTTPRSKTPAKKRKQETS